MYIKHLTNKKNGFPHSVCMCMYRELYQASYVLGTRIHSPFQRPLREGMAQAPHVLVASHSLTQSNIQKLWSMSERGSAG